MFHSCFTNHLRRGPPARVDPAAATETEIDDRTFDPVDDTTYTTNRCYTLSSSAETTILGACHDH